MEQSQDKNKPVDVIQARQWSYGIITIRGTRVSKYQAIFLRN